MGGIISLVLMILFVLLGLVYCFWGYKYLRLILFFYAFFAGGLLVYNFLAEISPELGYGNIIIAVTIGLILGALAYFFVKFAIFLVGGAIGLMIFNIIRDLNGPYFDSLDAIYVFLIGLAFFVVLGVITVMAKKHLLIIFSAIYGAYSMVTYAGVLVGALMQPDILYTVGASQITTALEPYSIFNGAPEWTYLLPIIVFSILGIISQYNYTAKKMA